MVDNSREQALSPPGWWMNRASLSGARRVRVVLACLLAAAMPLRAQVPTLPGQLAERVTIAGDSARTFAVYLPSSASASSTGAAPRRLPVLLVLDPRGRALLALRLFAPAAEQLGWAVLSSYNSASDGAVDPNVAAVRDMLEWAQRSIRLDTRRVYLAGMSGTARATWIALADWRPNVAGLLLAAGTVPVPGTELDVARDATFAVVATTGVGDFNYEEARRFAARLDSLQVPARLEWHPGPHGWPTGDVAARALTWLEVRAMRAGRAALDSTVVRAWIASERARIDSLDVAGQWDLAQVAAASLARDAEGWPGIDDWRAKAVELAARPALRALRDRLRRELERERAQPVELERVLAWERVQAEAPDAADLLKRLDVPALRRAAASTDSVGAASALRRLARTQVMLAFYAPAAWERLQRPDRAARLREAAGQVLPAPR